MYFLGLLTHNEHQRESGFLSGEAAIDSLIAVEALKFVTGRQRPYQDNGDGRSLGREAFLLLRPNTPLEPGQSLESWHTSIPARS